MLVSCLSDVLSFPSLMGRHVAAAHTHNRFCNGQRPMPLLAHALASMPHKKVINSRPLSAFGLFLTLAFEPGKTSQTSFCKHACSYSIRQGKSLKDKVGFCWPFGPKRSQEKWRPKLPFPSKKAGPHRQGPQKMLLRWTLCSSACKFRRALAVCP